MQRALISGVIISVLLSLVGTFVVLRNMAFFADGIAHASLSGVAIGIVASVNPLYTALVIGVIFSVVIHYIQKSHKIASDTAIGIIFATGMALGVLIISRRSGYQPELFSFLFGNILTIRTSEVWMLGIGGSLILIFVLKNIKPLTLMSLDSEMAYVSGMKAGMLELILNAVLAVVVVMGIKILGVVLVSALLVIPVAASKIIAGSFRSLILNGIIISVITVLSGMLISYYLDYPAGPTVVLTGTGIFVLTAVFNFTSKVFSKVI